MTNPAQPVDVTFTWHDPTGIGEPSMTSEMHVRFDSVEQARAFRDELNRSIADAARQSDEASLWTDEPFADSADAMEWARAFLDRFRGRVIGTADGGTVDVDLGLLLSWFANAIETGRSVGQPPPAEPPAVVGPPAAFSLDDLSAWIAGYGVELADVRRLEIVTTNGVPRDLDGRELTSTWLRVERCQRDATGNLFSVFEAGERRLATELLLIPIHDMPEPRSGASA